VVRIERGPGTLTLVSRFSRPRALAILTGALAAVALLAARALPGVAFAFAVLALLVAVLGGRAVRAAFARGRVRVSAAVPLGRGADRPLAEFSRVRVETLAEARRRKAERQAHSYRARAGSELPSWLVPADAPGANDHLRRLVLDGAAGEPLAVTAWLAEDDLEPARAAVASVLGG
jgi:hypothetical protein